MQHCPTFWCVQPLYLCGMCSLWKRLGCALDAAQPSLAQHKTRAWLPGEPYQGSWVMVGSSCPFDIFLQIKVNRVKYQSPVSCHLAYIPKGKKKEKGKKNREGIKGPLFLFFIRICYPEPRLGCQALSFWMWCWWWMYSYTTSNIHLYKDLTVLLQIWERGKFTFYTKLKSCLTVACLLALLLLFCFGCTLVQA